MGPGQKFLTRVGLLFTAAQKYIWVGKGPSLPRWDFFPYLQAYFLYNQY